MEFFISLSSVRSLPSLIWADLLNEYYWLNTSEKSYTMLTDLIINLHFCAKKKKIKIIFLWLLIITLFQVLLWKVREVLCKHSLPISITMLSLCFLNLLKVSYLFILIQFTNWSRNILKCEPFLLM